MSRSIYAASVPFKVELNDWPHEAFKMFLWENEDEELPFETDGWKCGRFGDYESVGDAGDVSGTPFANEDMQVLFINEHQYASGGGLAITFCAMDRKSIECFCDDFGIDVEIQENAIVQQEL